MQKQALIFEVKRNTKFEPKCGPLAYTPISVFFSLVGFYLLTDVPENGYL